LDVPSEMSAGRDGIFNEKLVFSVGVMTTRLVWHGMMA